MRVEELFAEYMNQMISQGGSNSYAHRDAHYDDPHIQEYWDEP